MRIVVRLAMKVLLLWVLACIERSIGIPVLFLVLSIEWATQFGHVSRYAWFIYCTVLLMSLFELMPLMAFLVIYGLWVWLAGGEVVVKSKTARLIIGIMGGSLLTNWLMPGQLSVGSLVYVVLVTVSITILTKRKRLLYTYKRVV